MDIACGQKSEKSSVILLRTVTVKQNTSCAAYCKAYDLVHGWKHHQMKICETFKFALFQIYVTQIN